MVRPKQFPKFSILIFFISAEINERNKIIPPAAYANKHSSSDDEDSDFKDVLIPHESGTTQVCCPIFEY